MKILIAPDSFKDCLTASKVAEYLSLGLQKSSSEFTIKCLPMADGGEGTVDAIVGASGGNYIFSKVHDPLNREITAKYGVTGEGNTAVIEMAAASGLELLAVQERNPWDTLTFGTGELMLDALNKGFRRIIIGIGGSATNDGGTGMASALGVKFYNNKNNLIIPTGGSIADLDRIDLSGIDKRLQDTEIVVATDVKNPLTGQEGASYMYARQKGATEKMIKKLDSNLKRLAAVIRKDIGIEVENIPGSGAAGGLGAGLLAFCNATLLPGFEIVKNETQLEKYCNWADVIITGEGKIDAQTQYGKTPFGIATLAKKFDKKIIAVSGTLGEGYEELYTKGFDVILSISEKPLSLEESISQAPVLLENTGFLIGKTLQF
jgi:glycerate kinase